MKVEYQLTVSGKCPADGGRDAYLVTVHSRHTIAVEDILAAVKASVAEPAFQEIVTERISRFLGATVKTIGTHSGVKVRCVCEVG